MPVNKLEEQPMDRAQRLESYSAAIKSSEVEPSIEDKYKFYTEGLRKYETFLRDGYFDIYHKEMEYQLQRNGVIFDMELGRNSEELRNYEGYKKFLYHEHNKIIAAELAEEGDTRERMLDSCTHMKWSQVEKILDRRQKIMMKRKQALFDNRLEYIAEKNKIMLQHQYYKENDGVSLFMRHNKLADYLTLESGFTEYK